MKLLFCIYAALLIAIQYPLFFGKGSWKTVSEYEIELKSILKYYITFNKVRVIILYTQNQLHSRFLSVSLFQCFS